MAEKLELHSIITVRYGRGEKEAKCEKEAKKKADARARFLRSEKIGIGKPKVYSLVKVKRQKRGYAIYIKRSKAFKTFLKSC